MENNFTMETYKQEKDLHIDMKGTFDGASAFALIQRIEKQIQGTNNNVYVETQNISKVYPFGRTILSSNIPRICRKSVCFSGAMADRIAPEGCVIKDGHPKQNCHKCTGNCKNCLCNNASNQINAQTERIR